MVQTTAARGADWKTLPLLKTLPAIRCGFDGTLIDTLRFCEVVGIPSGLPVISRDPFEMMDPFQHSVGILCQALPEIHG